MSPTNAQDARALTYLARRLRDETHGCKAWDEAGTYAKIAELVGQNLALSIERVLCHATDPDAKTPGAIHRNFTPPKPSEQAKGHPHPPTKAQECPLHPGKFRTSCGGCHADKHAATYEDDGYGPPETEGERMTREQALDTARAAVVAAKGQEPDHVAM